MSWKEVFRDLSDMEGIVQRMEEETQDTESEEAEDQPRQDDPKPSTSQQQPDLKTNLLSEILNFKKTQLKSIVKKEDDEKSDDVSPEVDHKDSRSHFSFDHVKSSDRISLLEERDRRGSSGILRRPSLGVEPSSPAAASADRLSVTFKMETEVHDVDPAEDDDVMIHEDQEDPVAIILGSLKRTISTASGLRKGSFSSADHKTYVSFDSPEPDIAPPDIPSDDDEDDDDDDGNTIEDDNDEYSSGMREIIENVNLDVRRRSSGGSRSRRLSTVSGMMLRSSRPGSRHSEESRRSESGENAVI